MSPDSMAFIELFLKKPTRSQCKVSTTTILAKRRRIISTAQQANQSTKSPKKTSKKSHVMALFAKTANEMARLPYHPNQSINETSSIPALKEGSELRNPGETGNSIIVPMRGRQPNMTSLKPSFLLSRSYRIHPLARF